MSLVTKIETIVNTLYPDYTFMLATPSNADATITNLEKTEVPVVILEVPFDKPKSYKQNANLITTNDITLWFMQTRARDNTDVEINTKIEAMELVGDRVMNNILQEDIIMIDNGEDFNYTSRQVWNFFISVLCGVKITMKVKEQQIISYCQTP